ncbi:MAG: hypothetical protein EBR18_03255 [Betaproteobacteria bacterium]|nr:hypothetical protein [Betaproteobacteria bacterium]
MFTIFATKKLLDRVKVRAAQSDTLSSTLLGDWYATALFWKPQVALLVNEKTLLPVLMPLAPAADLGERFPKHLESVLAAHGMSTQFIDHELAQMNQVQYAKTSNRSVVGVMNQFSYLAEGYREYLETRDLLVLSLKLSETPCSPLYKSHTAPDRALQAYAIGHNAL